VEGKAAMTAQIVQIVQIVQTTQVHQGVVDINLKSQESCQQVCSLTNVAVVSAL
jgi:hypothetical protein